MLTKLIKYDFKATLRLLMPITLIVVVLGLIARILFGISMYSLNHSFYGNDMLIVNIMSTVMIIVSLSMVFILAIVIFWSIVNNFWSTLFGDEGYLSHTLPVKTSQLILSKLIVANIWQIIFFVVILAFIVGACTLVPDRKLAEFYNEIKTVVSHVNAANAVKITFMIILYILIIFADISMQYLMIFLAMSVGQLANRHKKLLSVVCYIGISTALRTISQLGVSIFYFNPNNLEIFKNDTIAGIITVLLISLLFVLVISIALFMCIDYILKNKLNLE